MKPHYDGTFIYFTRLYCVNVTSSKCSDWSGVKDSRQSSADKIIITGFPPIKHVEYSTWKFKFGVESRLPWPRECDRHVIDLTGSSLGYKNMALQNQENLSAVQEIASLSCRES